LDCAQSLEILIFFADLKAEGTEFTIFGINDDFGSLEKGTIWRVFRKRK